MALWRTAPFQLPDSWGEQWTQSLNSRVPLTSSFGPLQLCLWKWQSDEPEGNFRKLFFSSSSNICLLGSLRWHLCWKLWVCPWPCHVFTLLGGYPELCWILLPDFLLFCHFPSLMLWLLNSLWVTRKVKV